MKSPCAFLCSGKSGLKLSRASFGLLATAFALGGTVPTRADPNAAMFLTSPEVQNGNPVPLSGFSTAAALESAGNSCGLNTIVKQVDDKVSQQFFTLLFGKKHISTASITLSESHFGPTLPVYYRVDLIGVAVESIRRADMLSQPFDPLAIGGSDLLETITLRATKFKYTYTPVNPVGQPSGPPVSFGWDCATNRPF
jgi:hypothetical protein